MKLVDNLSRHKVSQVFKTYPEWTLELLALIAEKTIFDLLGMLESLPFRRLVCFVFVFSNEYIMVFNKTNNNYV